MCGFVADYCAMDLMILMDSSGSIRDNQVPNTRDNWSQVKEFAKAVVRTGARVGRFFDRVALIYFSNMASLAFDFDRYLTLGEIEAAIDRVPYVGATTNTSLALQLGRRVFQNPAYGWRRQNATHIMLLFTDLFEVYGPLWNSLFLGNTSLIRGVSPTIHRFCKYAILDISKQTSF